MATFDTTSTRTTSSSTCPSTNRLIRSEVSPSFPSVASTYTRTKFSAASRPSMTATSSPSHSLSRVDLRCSRATSTHQQRVSSPVLQLRSGLAARLLCHRRFPWRACMTVRRLRRSHRTTRPHRQHLRNPPQSRPSRQKLRQSPRPRR